MASLLNFISSALSLFGDMAESCDFVISCAGASITLPVAPASYDVTAQYHNETVAVNNYGDIRMLGMKGLKSISFSSLLPAQDYSWAHHLTDPWSIVKQIEEYASIVPRQPARLSISGTSINMNVSIDEFKYSQQDCSGDIYYTLTFSEYPYILTKSGIQNEVTGLNSRVAEIKKETTTQVHAGDHLLDVSARVTRGLKIAEQGEKRLKLYKAFIKGGATTGSLLVIKDAEKWVKQ